MVTIRSQFDEKLQWILSGENLDEMVFRARTVAQMDPVFPQLIRMSCIDAEKIVGVPEGMPNTIKLEEDLPVGIADTTLRQEIRRIRNFQAGKDMQRIPPVKREAAWIQILEAVHPNEARMLTLIKDQTLFYHYPLLFDLMKSLTGGDVDIPRKEQELPKLEAPADQTGVSVEVPLEATEPAHPPEPKKKGGRSKKQVS